MSVVYMTTAGYPFLEAGGFQKWIAPKQLKSDLQESLKLQKLVGDVRKLKLDIENTKGVTSGANLSIIIAAISALIALISVIFAVTKK